MTTTVRTDDVAGMVEIRSIDYVPVKERHGRAWHLGPVWFQANAQLVTLAVGAIGVAGGLNLIWALIAISAGVLVGTLFMAFHSAQGPKLGLPQMIQSRAQFGYYGSLLPVIVAVLLFIGFNVFNTILGGQVVQELFPGLHSKLIAYVPVVFLSLVLTIFGYELIHVSLRWATWLFIAVYGVFMFAALFTVGPPHGSFELGRFDLGLFLLQFGAVVSYQLAWAPYVSEYSRYLPPDAKSSTVAWWTYGGSALGAIPMLFGAFILSPAVTTGPVAAVHDVAQQIFHGFGAVIMIVSLPGLVAVIAMNMYSGGLSSLTTVDTVRRVRPTFTARWISIGFIAVAGTVPALTLSSDFLTNFSNFLTLILYFMIPWTAINLIDFFLVRKGNYAIRELFIPRGMYGAWSWRGLTAYVIAFAAMIPFMNTTIWEGPVAKSLSGGDISPFVGFPVAAVLYYLFSRDIDTGAEAKVAVDQNLLLEAEALAHEGIGESEPAFDVGARVVDELEGSVIQRHPSA
jgi:nucleobase:cation symporter-1, NCS1 family